MGQRAIRILVVAVTALLVTAGFAFAGVLPDPIQDAASEAADSLGLDVPDSDPTNEDESITPEPDDEQESADDDEPDAPEGDDDGSDPAGDDDEGKHPDNHGAAVSEAAHDDAYEGKEKGEHVSETARSDAGKPEQSQPHDDDSDDADSDNGGGSSNGSGNGNGNGHGND